MAEVNIAKELKQIKDAVENLTSKIEDGNNVTGNDDIDLQPYNESDLLNITNPDIDNDYLRSSLIIDNKIGILEKDINEKFYTFEKDINKSIKDNIKENKPKYFALVSSIVIPIIIAVVVVFWGIVPIYVENIMINKKVITENDINDDNKALSDVIIKIINQNQKLKK